MIVTAPWHERAIKEVFQRKPKLDADDLAFMKNAAARVLLGLGLTEGQEERLFRINQRVTRGGRL